jgi:histidine triad (HIT) family protein
MAVEAGLVHRAALSASGCSRPLPVPNASDSTQEALFCSRPWLPLNHFSRARWPVSGQLLAITTHSAMVLPARVSKLARPVANHLRCHSDMFGSDVFASAMGSAPRRATVPEPARLCYEDGASIGGPNMSLDGNYDEGNIFARIIRGEIPSAKIYEDDKVLAFMDAFPQGRGHSLVVHKQSRARNLLDAEPQALAEVMVGVQKVARAIRAALKPDGIVVTQFNGTPAGQTIFHLHFHILPRWEGEALASHGHGHGHGQAEPGELVRLGKQIGGHIR